MDSQSKEKVVLPERPAGKAPKKPKEKQPDAKQKEALEVRYRRFFVSMDIY